MPPTPFIEDGSGSMLPLPYHRPLFASAEHAGAAQAAFDVDYGEIRRLSRHDDLDIAFEA
ncbi:hypothetical protein WM33_25805 [Burkholderia multivorans]|nr:hypothetical protein WM33_25805 [Burkholderia multivorans]KVZ73265.1 hypothetical protein WL23_29640 [Burkholderia multivorans]